MAPTYVEHELGIVKEAHRLSDEHYWFLPQYTTFSTVLLMQKRVALYPS